MITADGHTYERAKITEWLTSHDLGPLSNTQLPPMPGLAPRSSDRNRAPNPDIVKNKMLIPNFAIKKAVQEWKERSKNETPQAKVSAPLRCC